MECKEITEADCTSAKIYKGYKDILAVHQHGLQPYLQDITKLPCKEIIYDVKDGWFLNLHSPYDGEIALNGKIRLLALERIAQKSLLL